MCDNVKALLAKVWKDEALNLEPGRYHFDELLTIRVSGTVEKHGDQLVAPTTSVPLILTLALFWEKCGITREHALRLLRSALFEAMTEGTDKGERIEARMKDVEAAVTAVKDDLLAKLPKARRSGEVVTKDLHIEVLPVIEEVLMPAA